MVAGDRGGGADRDLCAGRPAEPQPVRRRTGHAGTTNQLKAQGLDLDAAAVVAGVEQPGASVATRVRMITYFVNTTLDPTSPRLMRQLGGTPANAVAFEIEAFRLSYDIADGVLNPVGVRLDATDLTGAGDCDDPGDRRGRDVLGESGAQGQRRRRHPVAHAHGRDRRLLPQHSLHPGGAAQPGLRPTGT